MIQFPLPLLSVTSVLFAKMADDNKLIAVDGVEVPQVGENTGEMSYVHVPIETLVRNCVKEQVQLWAHRFNND